MAAEGRQGPQSKGRPLERERERREKIGEVNTKENVFSPHGCISGEYIP